MLSLELLILFLLLQMIEYNPYSLDCFMSLSFGCLAAEEFYRTQFRLMGTDSKFLKKLSTNTTNIFNRGHHPKQYSLNFAKDEHLPMQYSLIIDFCFASRSEFPCFVFLL